MIGSSILTFGLTAISCAVLTGCARYYALKRNLVAQPSHRGLHQFPVPSGGGVAIMAAVSVSIIGLALVQHIPLKVAAWWLIFGFGFGLLGWFDDVRNLPVITRLWVQLFLAAALCISIVAVYAAQFESILVLRYKVIIFLLVPFAIVWIINLYNFMDGADGFAAGGGAVAAASGGLIAGLNGASETMLVALAVAGGAGGFLFWNWQPAKIFMGDAGSYFLGFQFCALIIHDTAIGPGPWMWLILLAPFVTDGSLTLLRRILARERFWLGHRSHLYQSLILAGKSHASVSIWLIGITVIVLMPCAWATIQLPHLAISITTTVYALAAIIWTMFINKVRPHT